MLEVIDDFGDQVLSKKEFKHNILFGNRAVEQVEKFNELIYSLSDVRLKPRVIIFLSLIILYLLNNLLLVAKHYYCICIDIDFNSMITFLYGGYCTLLSTSFFTYFVRDFICDFCLIRPSFFAYFFGDSLISLSSFFTLNRDVVFIVGIQNIM